MDGMANVRTHRLVLGQGLAWAWLAVAVVFAVDAVRRADGRQLAVILLALAAGSMVAYVFGLRPAVVEEPAALVVVNPVRTTQVPWTAVTDVDVADVLRVHAGTTVVRCFAVPRTRRRVVAGGGGGFGLGFGSGLPRAEPEGGGPSLGRSDVVQARLLDVAEQLGGLRGGPGVVTRWAWSGAGVLAGAGLLVVVAVLVGLA